MTLIQIQDAGKRYAGRWIFRHLNWSIEEGTRLGLIGPNGAGKSTLFRLLAAREQCDEGLLSRKRDMAVAYLPQHIQPEARTPVEVVMESRSDIAEVERELAEIAQRFGDQSVAANPIQLERLLQSQEQALEKLERLGGAGVEGEARSMLRDLGLDESHQDLPLERLSGGQRKLVYLVACLIRRPNLLLLDEPETHLDLAARGRLEAFIRTFRGAVVIISHDRYLLDETVTAIAELDGGSISEWPGNYSSYAIHKELGLKRQEVVYSAQQKEIARLEDAIRRFRQWANELPDSADNSRLIKQARNKQRQIDSMDKIERPVLERRKMALQLRQNQRSGQRVTELTDVDVVAGARQILANVTVSVHRGERVGIMGPNGSGKTLLTRIFAQDLEPAAGSIWHGPSVQIGYFAQNPGAGKAGQTAIDELRDVRPMREDEAVSQLMKFLFRYDQTRQPIETLSGGERSRLQLLCLMLGQANLLVLDEPTNHLDIESMEVLEQSLERYDGTVIVVSHDRYFLDRIVDRTLEVTNGAVTGRMGGYSTQAADGL